MVRSSWSFRQIDLEFNLKKDKSVSFKVSHDFLLVSLIFPLTRIVLHIKETNGSPVPIVFSVFLYSNTMRYIILR